MTDRPLLMSGPLVLATLAGRKTMTRRVMSPQPTHHQAPGGRSYAMWRGTAFDPAEPEDDLPLPGIIDRCPYGVPGDRLWVRERWRVPADYDRTPPRDIDAAVDYATDPTYSTIYGSTWGRWRPSIHMPRWASRLTLVVDAVRVERVQDISETDAEAEGCTGTDGRTIWLGLDEQPSPQVHFAMLWSRINGERPGCAWTDNPFVWCISYHVERAT